MKVVCFDLETRKLASDLAEGERGWELLKTGKGGISALCIYDGEWLYCYDDNEITEISSHLESADRIIGFNSIGFDLPIVEGLRGRRLVIKEHYDIRALNENALGLNGYALRRGENTLDAISKRNLGRGKIDHGDNITNLIAEGKWGRVFRYCGDDVRLTWDLYNKLLTDGGLINAHGVMMQIPLPTAASAPTVGD